MEMKVLITIILAIVLHHCKKLSPLHLIFELLGLFTQLMVSPSNAFNGMRFSSDFCCCDASLITNKFVKVEILCTNKYTCYLVLEHAHK